MSTWSICFCYQEDGQEVVRYAPADRPVGNRWYEKKTTSDRTYTRTSRMPTFWTGTSGETCRQELEEDTELADIPPAVLGTKYVLVNRPEVYLILDIPVQVDEHVFRLPATYKDGRWLAVCLGKDGELHGLHVPDAYVSDMLITPRIYYGKRSSITTHDDAYISVSNVDAVVCSAAPYTLRRNGAPAQVVYVAKIGTKRYRVMSNRCYNLLLLVARPIQDDDDLTPTSSHDESEEPSGPDKAELGRLAEDLGTTKAAVARLEAGMVDIQTAVRTVGRVITEYAARPPAPDAHAIRRTAEEAALLNYDTKVREFGRLFRRREEELLERARDLSTTEFRVAKEEAQVDAARRAVQDGEKAMRKREARLERAEAALTEVEAVVTKRVAALDEREARLNAALAEIDKTREEAKAMLRDAEAAVAEFARKKLKAKAGVDWPAEPDPEPVPEPEAAPEPAPSLFTNRPTIKECPTHSRRPSNVAMDQFRRTGVSMHTPHMRVPMQ